MRDRPSSFPRIVAHASMSIRLAVGAGWSGAVTCQAVGVGAFIEQSRDSEEELAQLRAKVTLEFAEARERFHCSAAEWLVIRQRFLSDEQSRLRGRLNIRF